MVESVQCDNSSDAEGELGECVHILYISNHIIIMYSETDMASSSHLGNINICIGYLCLNEKCVNVSPCVVLCVHENRWLNTIDCDVA